MSPATAHCLAIIAALSVTAGALSLASAWVFHEDDRHRSHSTMVGTLEIDLPEGRGLGTAVLVDHCGILTNFHTAFGPWYVTARRAPSRAFAGRFTLTEAARLDGKPPSARAIPVVWGDYRGPDRQFRVPHQDWAYLALDDCLGAAHGHFQLRDLDLDEPDGMTGGFAAMGYSTGEQMMDPTCSVAAIRSRGGHRSWRHDCALEAGDSGGPIFKLDTRTLVALGAGVASDPAEPRCADGSMRIDGASLAVWSTRCANLAVPLTRNIIDRVAAARLAVGVQRALTALGYDAGPLGAVDDPQAITAIRQVQREMGWPATGEPTDALRKVLVLRLKLLVS